MTTAYSTLLGLALPVQGELTGVWGDTVDNGITRYLDIAVAGTVTLTNDGAVTLSLTNGDASATNIVSSLTGAGTVSAQFAIIQVTGTLTIAKVLTAPSSSRTFVVVNAATGSTVTVKASGQTGVSIAVGETAFVYFNGTDYAKIVGTATAGAAGGSTTQVQYNNAGVLAGITGATTNGTALTLVSPNLGSPASVGTMPAFTLGGTVAGGGNQINNVIIGTTTPLAGSFTSLTASTTLGVTGVSTLTGGAVVQGLTVGLGAGAVATNTAVGVSALAANTSGNNNTAFGNQAGQLNTTGTDNVYVGSVAGYNAIGSTANTGVGSQALRNSTGSNNTGIGYFSGTAITSGGANTSLGAGSLFSNNTASNNTAVGYQAGYAATGANNLFLGVQAAVNATTGTQNTFVGAFVAGQGGVASQMTTGSKNTILGGFSGNQGGLDIRTASNYIVLSDGDGNPRGIFDGSGNLLVGTTTASSSITNGFTVTGAGAITALGVGHVTGSGSSTNYVVFNYNGSAIGSITQSGTAAVLYNITSDQRLKENIQDADSASSLIDALQVRKFDWKSDNTHQRYGFIAQELVAVAPEAVHQPIDTNEMMAVDYSKLVPMLVKEIQSLRKRLADAGIA